MSGRAEVKGAEAIKAKLAELARRYPEAAKKALFAEANVIFAEAVRLTPVDTGRLRASAYVAPPEQEGEKIQAKVGYGAEYSLAVHEKTEVHHAEGTSAKFLTRPVEAHRRSFPADMAERIKGEVG